MNKHIVFLNGPPSSGKDHFARILNARLGFKNEKFAKPITDGVSGMFGLNHIELEKYRGEAKDEPAPLFGDLTPRDVWISFSEQWAKPTFGQEIFGNLAAHRCRMSNFDRICFSDSGFDREARAVCGAVEGKKLLIRIFREGCSFEGDSRSYIDPDFCASLNFVNRGVEDDERRMVKTILAWLHEDWE